MREPEKTLRISSAAILVRFIIRAGFLAPESRQDLIDLARDGSVAHRLAPRENAVLLLDGRYDLRGNSLGCSLTTTVRIWYQDYRANGIRGLANFGHQGGGCRLTVEQHDKLKLWIVATCPAPPA